MVVGEGKNIGMTTGMDGGFALGLPSKNITVRISFIGMESINVDLSKLNLASEYGSGSKDSKKGAILFVAKRYNIICLRLGPALVSCW